MTYQDLKTLEANNVIIVNVATWEKSNEFAFRTIEVKAGNNTLFFVERSGIESLRYNGYTSSMGTYRGAGNKFAANELNKLVKELISIKANESAVQAEETSNDNVTISEMKMPTSRIFDGKKLTKGNKKINKHKKEMFVNERCEKSIYRDSEIFEAAKISQTYQEALKYFRAKKRKELFKQYEYSSRCLHYLGFTGYARKPKKMKISRNKVCLGLQIMIDKLTFVSL